MPAQIISHYHILGPLGNGGMGVVYRAEDTTLHRTVALKFLPQQTPNSPKVNERLRHEARIASALNHPNICTIYEVGEDAGEVFIAMEYVEGQTLSELIREGPIPVEAMLRYARQIASALAHAHEHGVIHGDLKPLNIIVTRGGEAKILDFGLARRKDPTQFDKQTLETASDEDGVGLGGTFPYMAPEQIEGGDASPRTDLWSFGIVLYEMAAGERPFKGANLYILCNAILRDPPRPLHSHILPGLATIISRCLEKEPIRRYQRASEARAVLEALTPSMQKDSSVVTQSRPHRLRLISMVVIVAAIAAAGVVLLIRGDQFWKLTPSSSVPSKVLLGVLPPISSGDASQAAFENGLADTLSSRLGELSNRHQLAVIPMSLTVEKHVTTVDSARQEFGVNLVLVFNVQRATDNVRVNYALVDPRSHQQVRSGTITAAAGDPFSLQDRVFESVAAAMELQLAPQEKKALTAHGTTEPVAYDFYVQGRGYLQDYVVPEKIDNAIILFHRALDKDPTYAGATAGLGEAYWQKYQITHDNQWAVAATTNCKKASELSPDLPAAHSCLGRVFSASGNYELAAEQYRRLLELEPTSDNAYGGLATAYERLGRLDQAEQLYKQAIAARPDYWATYNWLGNFYMSNARYEDAATMYSRVISLVPDSFTGYYNLGGVRVLQGRYSEAIPLLQNSLSIRPTADGYSNLGTAYFQMRQYADAIANFEEAVKLDSKDYAMWGNLGDAYYWAAGRRSESPAAYRTAIELGTENLRLNPNDAQLRGYLAAYYAMLGKHSQALENLQASLRLQPKSPDLLLNAAIVYQQLGETNHALDALEKAISLGVSSETLRDMPNFDELRTNPRFNGLISSSQRK